MGVILLQTCNFDIIMKLLPADKDNSSKKYLLFSVVYMDDAERIPLRALAREMVLCMRGNVSQEMSAITQLRLILYRKNATHKLTFFVEPVGDWIHDQSAELYILQQIMY